MPYVRPSLPGVDADVRVKGGDAPVLKDLGNGLLVAYVVDLGDRLQYVQHRHLEASGVVASDLHSHAVHNLRGLVQERLRVESHGKVFAVSLDGNFEASLILLDEFWSEPQKLDG